MFLKRTETTQLQINEFPQCFLVIVEVAKQQLFFLNKKKRFTFAIKTLTKIKNNKREPPQQKKKVVIKGRVFLRSVNFQIHKGLFQFFGNEETKKKAKKRQIPDSNKSQYCSKI